MWQKLFQENNHISLPHSATYVMAFMSIVLLLLVSCSSPARDATEPGPGEVISLKTAYGVQHARAFVYSDTVTTPLLVVVLHGDAPNGPPDYQYIFAEESAGKIPGSVVTALLRPGYSDPAGLRSAGRRGFIYGDNYTPSQLNAIAQAIKELQDQYSAKEVILIGHSGGAAIAANLMGREPDLAHTAVLLSCPCDLEPWRKHMSSGPGGLFWHLPVNSVSPLSVVENISANARIRLIVGANDPVTLPKFSRIYEEALKQHGLDVELTILPDRGHEILNDDAVLNLIETLVEKEPDRNH